MTTEHIDHGAIIAAEHNLVRSPHWPAVEHAHLLLEPSCRCCTSGQSTVKPQVHHAIVPFHIAILLGRPDLELDQRNLISLCETEKDKPAPNHHLLIGHLDDFKTWNPDVMTDAIHTWHGKTEEQIKADHHWQEKVKRRPPVWKDMSDQYKHDLKALLDKVLPIQAHP